jgi:RHH-type proline utilization regulon transcriptional repressor/proline dehydrogenase/delta 1-pyrroline-5-carboxylate dehydrogenase
MGIHSRLESTIATAERLAKVGNLYINRNMIGAVVGVQPFGGEGLSGTGPKAGGPNYLLRFVHERTFTQNITACGGNTTLLSSI